MTRPKCLLVLHTNYTSIDDSKAILKQAWQKNLLDFTILQIDNKNNANVIIYNPFFDEYQVIGYPSLDVQLFPDKFKNLNGYKLKVGVNMFCWPECEKKLGKSISDTYVNLFKIYKEFADFTNASSDVIKLPLFSYYHGDEEIADNNLNFIMSFDFMFRMTKF